MIGLPLISFPSASASRDCCRSQASLVEQFAQIHRLARLVRHLDADDVAAGHGGDAHRGDRQAAGDVVGQSDHPGAADARRRLQLVQRHHRAGADFDDMALHAVIGQHRFPAAAHCSAAPPRWARRWWRGRAPAAAGERRETPAASNEGGSGRDGAAGFFAGINRGRLDRDRFGTDARRGRGRHGDVRFAAPYPRLRLRRHLRLRLLGGGAAAVDAFDQPLRGNADLAGDAADQPGHLLCVAGRIPHRLAGRPPFPGGQAERQHHQHHRQRRRQHPDQRRTHRADQFGAGGQHLAFQHEAGGTAQAGRARPGNGAAVRPGQRRQHRRRHRHRRQQGGQAQRQVDQPPVRAEPPGPGQQGHPGQHAGNPEALQQQIGQQRPRRAGQIMRRPGGGGIE